MDRFGQITVRIQNLNPEVALHCMLLATQLGKFENELRVTRNLPVAWTSYENEPNVTFKWKKYRGSEEKFHRLDKSVRKEKVVQGPIHTSRTSDTNRISVSLCRGD